MDRGSDPCSNHSHRPPAAVAALRHDPAQQRRRGPGIQRRRDPIHRVRGIRRSGAHYADLSGDAGQYGGEDQQPGGR